ncbi:MAG: hypothetical protein FWE37_05135, partial [Spirochaetaceae bacterium]|nr:hypothetical protein [Spirochaetaceae bacterium]
RTISTINEIFIAGTVPNRADDSIWIGGEADAGRIEWDWDDGGFGFNNNNAPLQLAPLGEFTLAPLELSGGNFAFSDDDFDDDDDGAAPVNFEPDIGSTDDFSLN